MPEATPDAQPSQPTRPVRPRGRWLRRTAILAAVVAAVLVLLPYGIRWGLQHWLLSHGADAAHIEDVDFNPFTGHLTVHNAEIVTAGKPQLTLAEATAHLDWLPLWHRRVRIRALDLHGLHATLTRSDDNQWSVGGIRLETPTDSHASDGGTPWGFALDRLGVNDAELRYQEPRLTSDLVITRASLEGLTSWNPQQPANIRLRGRLDQAPLDLEATLSAFTAEPEALGTIKLRNFALQPLAALAGDSLTKLQGRLNMDVRLSIAHGSDGFLLRQTGSVGANDVNVETAQQTVVAQTLAWKGQVDLRWGAALEGVRVAADGQLSTGPGGLTAGGWQLRQSALTWNGRISYGMRDVPTGYDATGGLDVQGLRVVADDGKVRVAQVGNTALSGIHVRGTYDIAVADAQLGNVQLAHPAPPPGGQSPPAAVSAKSVALHDLRLQDLRNLGIAQVGIDGLTAILKRQTNGTWYGLDVLPRQEPSTPGNSEQAPAALAIGSVTVGGDSHVRFEDHTVEPVFELDSTIQAAEVRNLDSARPTEPSPVVLRALLGKYGKLNLKGQIQPFTPRLNLSLKGQVEQLDLPPLSSYTAPQLGYDLASGHLNADVDVTVHNGHLQGSTALALNKLRVTPRDAAKMRALTAQLSVPLDSALSMLRDQNDNIHIKVPITGDVDDPRFSFGDAINQALGKTIRLAAVSYLKFALQPYGAIITLAQMADKSSQAVKLQPILFAPGTAVLSGKADDYLRKIQALMTHRPELSLRLCPQATNGDRQALTAAAAKRDTSQTRSAVPDSVLNNLAETRAQAVKSFLVKLGSPPARLYICKPSIDSDPRAEPRVEVTL